MKQMRLFICFMPVIAIAMLTCNYSRQSWGREVVFEADPRATAILQKFKGTKTSRIAPPQKKVFLAVFEDEE